ncbi:MAG: lipoyl(octanoyl) transferase LipB [Alistipes sp.]|nr:lipoyl(octanoyl) transferase LipB [Alistipes sp.]
MQNEVIVEIRDLGQMPYGECWDLQRTLFDALCQKKLEKRITPGEAHGTILIVEHPAVYTLGKSGHQENMLVTEEYLKSLGAEFFHIDRGGDITFHGPGQLVCYPIIDLDAIGLGIRRYIEALEQSVIDLASEYGIEAHRSEGASGVWVTQGNRLVKLCAIGVRASHGVTMHGLAMNVATDLRWFELINPCGFTDRGVCSLKTLTQREVTMEEVMPKFINHLTKNLNVKYKK